MREKSQIAVNKNLHNYARKRDEFLIFHQIVISFNDNANKLFHRLAVDSAGAKIQLMMFAHSLTAYKGLFYYITLRPIE